MHVIRTTDRRALLFDVCAKRAMDRTSVQLQVKAVFVAEVSPLDSAALIKKKIKFSSYTRKFRMKQLQSHI
jgi:hypothetical protein